jgi:deazaflavin-dependent oxidoreductase (nitroreductase family)
VALTGRLVGMSENEERIARNRGVVDEFRASHGAPAGFEATPLLILTTIGAKTGETRRSPVAYLADGDRFVVFAANGGRDHDPAWSHNLRAHPRATVEVGDETVEVDARVTEGEERTALWERAVVTLPLFGGFAETTDRVIPVFVLEPAPQ